MFPWDVSASECELRGALNEGEASDEMHCQWISALVSMDDVDYGHIVTQGSDGHPLPLGAPDGGTYDNWQQFFHGYVERGCCVVPLYLEPLSPVEGSTPP